MYTIAYTGWDFGQDGCNSSGESHALDGEDRDVDYFRKVDVAGASTLDALRFTLESNDILE